MTYATVDGAILAELNRRWTERGERAMPTAIRLHPSDATFRAASGNRVTATGIKTSFGSCRVVTDGAVARGAFAFED